MATQTSLLGPESYGVYFDPTRLTSLAAGKDPLGPESGRSAFVQNQLISGPDISTLNHQQELHLITTNKGRVVLREGCPSASFGQISSWGEVNNKDWGGSGNSNNKRAANENIYFTPEQRSPYLASKYITRFHSNSMILDHPPVQEGSAIPGVNSGKR